MYSEMRELMSGQNFMKCLMRMFAEEDKGVVFYETVLTIKAQKHTVIECVPVPWEQFELIPGYFKVRVFSRFCCTDFETMRPARNRF